jgi:hypothetical protein
LLSEILSPTGSCRLRKDQCTFVVLSSFHLRNPIGLVWLSIALWRYLLRTTFLRGRSGSLEKSTLCETQATLFQPWKPPFEPDARVFSGVVYHSFTDFLTSGSRGSAAFYADSGDLHGHARTHA